MKSFHKPNHDCNSVNLIVQTLLNNCACRLLSIVLIAFSISVTFAVPSFAVISSIISSSAECKAASDSIQNMDSKGLKLFSAYHDSYKAYKAKPKDLQLNNQAISTLIDLTNNDVLLFKFALGHLGCFSQTNVNKIEYLKESSEDLVSLYGDYKNKLGFFSKYGDLYPEYADLSKTLPSTLIPTDFKPTATPKPSSVNSSSTQSLQSKLDAACKFASKAFSLDYPKFRLDAPALFAKSAAAFRPLVISYGGASNLMAGALAASREAHRWTNGATLVEASVEKSYITKQDGNNILALHDYCSAGTD